MRPRYLTPSPHPVYMMITFEMKRALTDCENVLNDTFVSASNIMFKIDIVMPQQVTLPINHCPLLAFFFCSIRFLAYKIVKTKRAVDCNDHHIIIGCSLVLGYSLLKI